MRTIYLLICLCWPSLLIAQKAAYPHEVARATGDLDKDKREDLVIVTQDTNSNTWPYRLQVFFAEPNGKYTLIATADSVIAPLYPDGKDGYKTGTEFSGISILGNVLIISTSLLRGHYEHKFRYQQDNFELIGCSQVYSNGIGTMITTDFNLSTGKRTEKKERYDTGNLISNRTKQVIIEPLPQLQHFAYDDIDLY